MGAYGRCIGATLVVVAAIMAACSGAASGATPAAPSPTYASDSVLVAFKPGASVSQRAAAVRAAGASQRRGLGRLAGNAEQLVLARGQRVEGALARLRANPAVRYAEPDYIVTTQETSNDPYLTDGRLWGMLGSFGTHAADAWAAGAVGSRDVYIGVIDEGIEIAHPDLAANVWTNPYDPLDGIDNDGNGFVDDTNGWDFAGGNRTVYDGTNDDHGTHVAGTIGAVGGNGVGVAGMNWRVTMISTKFLGARGGTTSNAVRALDYLVDLKRRHGLNIVATSNSWGGGSYSQTLADAINRSGDAGMLFIAAAGNDGTSNDSTPHYPSNYECTTRFDTK